MTDKDVVSLRDYIDRIVTDLDRRFVDALAQRDERVRDALASNDKRLEGMNEFREAMAQQSGLYVTRTEADIAHRAILDRLDKTDDQLPALLSADAYERRHEDLVSRINRLERALANIQGRAVAMAVVCSAATAFIVGVIAHVAKI